MGPSQPPGFTREQLVLIDRLADKGLDLPPEERERFVHDRCAGDEAVAREVMNRLNQASGSANETHTFATPAPGAATYSEKAGDVIGRYKLMQPLGEGGMGVVWMAEQEQPVRRRVALKLIRLGMDTRKVIARFEAERQTLAWMDHPNIAKVLDAGATESGRPFFVMELVRGTPITDYCDVQNVRLRDRLKLFTKVCSALQHAHQKGIIHRDLKPSNILVTRVDDRPVPKVIDFGIAKATQTGLTGETLTELGHFIGTPAYMSPEQTNPLALDIDTRSDVYSLGVVLYELLSGATPFDFKTMRRAGLDEILRMIREQEPSKPSAKLSTLGDELATVARCRGLEPKKLGTILRGELDWIILKALEKDRSRRYETANGLAVDIGRYLRDEPVVAGPPSAAYRVRKFVRRNRLGVAAASLVLAALVLGVIGTTWGMLRAGRAQGEALRRADELQQVASFQAEQLSDIDPGKMGLDLRNGLLREVRVMLEQSTLETTEIDARIAQLDRSLAGADFANLATDALKTNVFDRALSTIDEQFDGQPLVQARLLQSLAVTLNGLTMLDDAAGPQERALAIRRRELGDGHLDTLRSIHEQGWLHRANGDYEQADVALKRSLEGRRSRLGDEHPDTIESILKTGWNLQMADRHEEAEPYLREAVETSRRMLGDEHPMTLRALHRLGALFMWQDRFDEAERCIDEVLETYRRLQPDSLETIGATQMMGMVLYQSGRLAEAKPFYEEALEGYRRFFGSDHGETIVATYNYATVLYTAGEREEAARVLRPALAGYRRVYGDDHWRTLLATQFMGVMLYKLDRLDEAEAHYRKAAEGFVDAVGTEHRLTLDATNRVAALLNEQARYAEAEAFLRKALEQGIAASHGGGWLGSVFRSHLGESLRGLGRLAEAEPVLLEAYEGLEPPPPHANSKTKALLRIIDLYDAWHEVEPDAGYDTKVAAWRARLTELERPSDD